MGLCAGSDSTSPGYPVVVFGGRHADIVLMEHWRGARPLDRNGRAVCVVELSKPSGSAARRRCTAFAEASYEAVGPLISCWTRPDLWTPHRRRLDACGLLGCTQEIVCRRRVRDFIPWLISQRPWGKGMPSPVGVKHDLVARLIRRRTGDVVTAV